MHSNSTGGKQVSSKTIFELPGMQIKVFLAGWLFLLMGASLSAESTEKYVRVPVNISLVHKISIGDAIAGGTQKKVINSGFALNLLSGKAAKLRGVDISTIWSEYTEEIRGVQFAGLFSSTGTDASGAQFTGLFNGVGKNAGGVQFVGILNGVGGDAKGVQFAGGLNGVGGNVKGAQFAGIFNGVGGQVTGLQGASILNGVGDNFSGIQGAGILNGVGGNFSGVQGAGGADRILRVPALPLLPKRPQPVPSGLRSPRAGRSPTAL